MSVPMYTDRSGRGALGDLLRDLFSKVSELISTHIELTKTEIKVESRKIAMTAAFGVVAMALGFLFLLFLGFSLILLLGLYMGLAWASLITTGIYLVLAGILAMLAVRSLRKSSENVDVG